MGGYHGLALRTDGSLVGWGFNAYRQTNVPAGNGFVAIAAGEFHSLALRADGSLVGWGRNDVGQTSVPNGTFVAIAAGYSYGLAIRALTPADLIKSLIEQVKGLNLQYGIENSLVSKLEAALQALKLKTKNSEIVAVNNLRAFINAVKAERGKAIPAVNDDSLIVAAMKIIGLLLE